MCSIRISVFSMLTRDLVFVSCMLVCFDVYTVYNKFFVSSEQVMNFRQLRCSCFYFPEHPVSSLILAKVKNVS